MRTNRRIALQARTAVHGVRPTQLRAMRHPYVAIVAVGLVGSFVAGCTRVKPEARINEAAALAEERLGQRPDWLTPWDESPPDWTGDVILRPEEAVALALRNNRALRADLEMIGQADADLLQAGLLQNPMLSLMVMFPDGGGRAMLRGSGVPIQPLQDLWLIPARQEVATAELQQAVLRVADRAIETAAAVRSAYVRLQYAQRAIALIQDNIRLAEQTMRIIEMRQTAGQATQVAYNLALLRNQRLHSELLALKAEYRGEQRDLLLLVGFAGAPDHWTVQSLHEIGDELAPPAGESELVALGTTQRLDLKAAEWTAQAAERRITLMQREGWPDVAVGLGFERSPAPRSPRGPTIPARVGNAAAQAISDRVFGVAPMPQSPQVAPWQPRMRELKWTVGPMLDLEVPIFDQNQAQVAKAVSERNQKQAEYEARGQEITRDIRAALVKQQQALEQVQYYRSEIMPNVEQNLELAQQAFVAGQESLTVYLQAQEDLVMTRRTILEFVRDYHVSEVELERAVGGRLPPAGSDDPATQPSSAADRTGK